MVESLDLPPPIGLHRVFFERAYFALQF
jgi:hypothetical protein